jgi:hypothetical protein
MSEPAVEILDPETKPKPSKLRKFGPAIFWGTIVALPAMNMTASVFYYKTAKLNLELEQLKNATAQLTK